MPVGASSSDSPHSLPSDARALAAGLQTNGTRNHGWSPALRSSGGDASTIMRVTKRVELRAQAAHRPAR
jgi:hypothetical protein